jgi:membrane protease YdiL (CAAX protease family)
MKSAPAYPAYPATGLRARPEILFLVATVVLFAFFYLARADGIGTTATGGWFRVTAPPLSPNLHYVASAILLAVVPVAAARWLFGIRLRDLGLGLGRWREGLVWLAIGIPVALLAGRIAAGDPAMRAVYPLDPSVTPEAAIFIPHAVRNFLYYGAWEVLFRGVLLFGLVGRIGDGPANAAQTGLSVTAHFGRVMTETFSAIPAGLAFGWIDLRVRSVWYVAVIHWVVGTSMDWFIVAS